MATVTEKLLGNPSGNYSAVGAEDGDDPESTGAKPQRKYWPFSLPRRYWVAIMAFMGFCNIYFLRVNLSVAIVSMTEGNEFNWDSQTKGLILSSFFYGYIFTQLPGGWLANKYGGKRVLGYGVLITAVLTLLTPLAANQGAVMLVILRILQGFAEGVAYPAAHALWSRWAPAPERSRLVTIAFSGSYVGTVISLPASGILADYYGWESIFYVFGIVALLWTGLWFWNIAEQPADDKWITQAEVNYITCSLGPPSPTRKLPWKKMLTSGPVWAINVAHFAENWGFYTLLTLLPTYMKDVFNYNLSKSGFISALPYLVMAIVVQFAGILADWLRLKYLTTTQVRKLFTCGAFMIQTGFIVTAALITNDAVGAIICLTIAVGLGGFAWAGFSVNHLDLAPNYSSLLMGISNTFATLPGMISPALAGRMVSNGTAAEWRGVFSVSGTIYFIGGIIYGILASGEPQKWSDSTPLDVSGCIDSD